MKFIITGSHTFARTNDVIKQLEGHDLYKPCALQFWNIMRKLGKTEF